MRYFQTISVNRRAKALLEEHSEDATEFETDKMTRNWYQACMNESRIEELGLSPLIRSLKNLGGWPVLNQTKDDFSSFQWFQQVRKLNREGHSIKTIMNHDIDVDNKNSSYMVFRLGQPNLGLHQKYLKNGFNDKKVKNYFQYMVDAAVLLGAKKSRAMHELKKSLLFEIEVAKLLASRDEKRGPTKFFVPVSIKELDNDKFELKGASQSQSWHHYIQGLLQDAAGFTKEKLKERNQSIDINNNDMVIIRNPEYFVNVLKLINRTEPRAVANYMGWRVVMSSISFLNKDAQEIKRRYEKIDGLRNGATARWKMCVESSGFNQYLYSNGAAAASSMYIRRHFQKQDKDKVLEMVRYIRKSFESMIDNTSWMDDETKIKAKKKLNNMKQIIGYVDELLDDGLMKNLHAGNWKIE